MSDDRRALVAAIKADLERRSVDLSGPCGAFEITKRVAWALRETGAGLLDKPGGNNCLGFAVDAIAYRDGTIVDVLGDAGGANVPTWQVKPAEVDPMRWRVVAGPFDAPADPPAPIPEADQPATQADVKRLAGALEALDLRIRHAEAQGDANTEKIQQQIDQAIRNLEQSAVPLIALLQRLDDAAARQPRVHREER